MLFLSEMKNNKVVRIIGALKDITERKENRISHKKIKRTL